MRRLTLRKPEWPNKVFHPPAVRRAVAAILKERAKLPAKPKPTIVRRRIQTFVSMPRPTRDWGSTFTGEAMSKWHRRVLADREAARLAA